MSRLIWGLCFGSHSWFCLMLIRNISAWVLGGIFERHKTKHNLVVYSISYESREFEKKKREVMTFYNVFITALVEGDQSITVRLVAMQTIFKWEYRQLKWRSLLDATSWHEWFCTFSSTAFLSITWRYLGRSLRAVSTCHVVCLFRIQLIIPTTWLGYGCLVASGSKGRF